MGNQASTDGGGDTFGFRVLGIQEHSPASSIGLVSFFDFITCANGIRLDQRDSTFMELITSNEDRPMQLTVYNIKSQTTRDLMLTPTRNWPGKGMLGVTIRFDTFEGAEDHIIHILEVAKGSPAEIAGLNAFDDYLLGTPERVFRDPDDLFDEVMEKVERPFQCYAYNKSSDKVRIVTIIPHDKWEGEGYLGAEVGYGYLHRLPDECRKTTGTSIGYVTVSAGDIAATDRTGNRSVPAAGADTSSVKNPPAEHKPIENVVVATEDKTVSGEKEAVVPSIEVTGVNADVVSVTTEIIPPVPKITTALQEIELQQPELKESIQEPIVESTMT